MHLMALKLKLLSVWQKILQSKWRANPQEKDLQSEPSNWPKIVYPGYLRIGPINLKLTQQ